MYLHEAIFRHLELRHGKEWVWKLLLGTAEWGKRRGRRAVAVPQQAAESSAGTVLEIDSDELHEFLHLEEVKSGTKMIFWCQMTRRGTGLLSLINAKGDFSPYCYSWLNSCLQKAEGSTILLAKAVPCLPPHKHPSFSSTFWNTNLCISMVSKNTWTWAQQKHSYITVP